MTERSISFDEDDWADLIGRMADPQKPKEHIVRLDERTFQSHLPMSAFGGKADLPFCTANVCF